MTTIPADVEAASDILLRDGSWGPNLFPGPKRVWAKILANQLITASDHARLSAIPEVAEIAARQKQLDDGDESKDDFQRNLQAYFNWAHEDRAFLLALLSTLQSALARKDEALDDMLLWFGRPLRGEFLSDDAYARACEVVCRAREALATQPKEKA